MSRILFAWELGANLGHVGKFRPLGQKLRDAGHDVRFALRDVTSSRQFLGREGFPCYQAPMWSPKLRPKEKPYRSYADILGQVGWSNPTELGGIVHAWRALYDLIRPDVLVAAHAPTALLAAREMPFRKVRLGTGFECPPLTSPFPSLRYWAPSPPEDLLATEAAIAGSVNEVLGELGVQSSLTFLRDAQVADEDVLCTFAELDHYPVRNPSEYFGALFVDDAGAQPEWPDGGGERVFAYLRSSYVPLPRVLDDLGRSGRPVLAVVPDSSLSEEKSRTLRVVGKPVRMASVAAQARLYVSHGGHGAVAAMLLAGVPPVLLPQHMEQYILARRLEERSAGLMVDQAASAEQMRERLHEALHGHPDFSGASKFRAAHGAFERHEQLDNICATLTGRRTSPAEYPTSAVTSH